MEIGETIKRGIQNNGIHLFRYSAIPLFRVL